MAIKSKKIPLTQPQLGSFEKSIPIELGFVIDESLSMVSLKNELITAFNSLLAEQIAPNAYSSLVLFNDSPRLVFDKWPITQITKLDSTNYHPAGSTALLDAIDYGMTQIGHRFDSAVMPFKVLIAIFTDGFENSSCNCDRITLKAQILRRQTQGWHFIFVTPGRGASFGSAIGIPLENIVPFEPAKLRQILARLSQAIKAYRLGDRNYSRFLIADR